MFNTRPCKQMDLLTNYSAKSWLKERPEKLMSFLSAMWNLNSEEEFDAYEIASLIEQLYGCRNEKLALPISFRHILLTYNLSYNLSPAGSFTFLKDWLLENESQRISKSCFWQQTSCGKALFCKSWLQCGSCECNSQLCIPLYR